MAGPAVPIRVYAPYVGTRQRQRRPRNVSRWTPMLRVRHGISPCISKQAPLASRAGAVAPAPSECIGVHRWFQLPAFPALRARLPQRLVITTRQNPCTWTPPPSRSAPLPPDIEPAATPHAPVQREAPAPRQWHPPIQQRSGPPPPRGAVAPPCVANTPCTCPVARHCIAAARQHPMPSGAGPLGGAARMPSHPARWRLTHRQTRRW
jgi:hypothetical protein